MPTNLYGPNDNLHGLELHVVPALIRHLHEAELVNFTEVRIWGGGNPLREFLHVDDLANALSSLMKGYSDHDIGNAGSGQEITVRNLTSLIADVVDHKGQLIYDNSKPDGTPRKLINTSKLNTLGWRAQIELSKGMRDVYRWFTVSSGSTSA